MKNKQQAAQEKRLQAAKNQYKKDKADMRAIRLWLEKKLSCKEKRRITDAVKKAKRDGRIPQTAQQTIPYKEMCRDGICVVNDRYYTKQIEFLDINYQLAQNEDKNLIFENWCDFLNYFDSSIKFQLSFLNQRADVEKFRQSIDIPDQQDDFNAIRREYAGMLGGSSPVGITALQRQSILRSALKRMT